VRVVDNIDMPLAAPDNDFALLERFMTSADEEAFAEIVKRYAGVVYATSFRVLHDRGRAEDVSQEVFFRLLRRPQAVTQSLGGWLHQCATRLALDDLRSETARKRREANRRIELDNDADAQVTTWQEISPVVDEALATLPEESRELLVSHFLQGKSQNTIAVETRTSPATISRRMRDAVVALRSELRRKGVVVAPALLVGLCRMNAPAQAIQVPATLLTELGKMAIVGKPAAAATSFAWYSASAWCDAAAKTCGWPAEIVKQAVAIAASTAVAFAVAMLLLRAVSHNAQQRAESAAATAEVARVEQFQKTFAAAVQAQASRQVKQSPIPAPDEDVRVASAGERQADQIVLLTWPKQDGGSVKITYGDGRSAQLPQTLARKLVETQAGKTIEQLAEESRKSSAEP
jgi:RNA polymerase sigma factor (sigma-70 family)